MIFLTESGHFSEGATCNLFMVRNGKLITPPGTDNILEGIRRASVMDLARNEMGLEVVERSIGRSELYDADEVFFTGTAAEITAIRSVDKISVGKGTVGPVTKAIQKEFFGIVNGTAPDRFNWFTPVPVNKKQPVHA